MSAWGAGAMTVTRRAGTRAERAAAADGATPETPVPSLDTLIMWIPGEVIAAYAAIVLALQPEQAEGADPPPIEVASGWWLVGAIAFAAVLTFLGGFSKSDDLSRSATKELIARTALAAGALAIWSFVVPASAWYSIDCLAENQTVIPIVAGVVGAAFALFAEGVVRRVGAEP